MDAPGSWHESLGGVDLSKNAEIRLKNVSGFSPEQWEEKKRKTCLPWGETRNFGIGMRGKRRFTRWQ